MKFTSNVESTLRLFYVILMYIFGISFILDYKNVMKF